MRHSIRPLVLAVLLSSVVAAQAPAPPMQGQQGLTEGMVASAAQEVPDLVKRLRLAPGMTIADVGAGFGAWTVAFARALAPTGRVYATDIGERQIAFLREFVAREGLTTVTVLAAGERSTNLPNGCCDALLIRDAYHHLTSPIDILRSVATALKPGGRLAIADFRPRPNSAVPTGVPADRLGHGVPVDVVVREVTTNGFTLVSRDEQWSPTSQPNDLFLLVFRKD